jgi:drug/metabolite transporter (DMT)-like permease
MSDRAGGVVAGYLKVAAAAALWGTFSLFFRPAERMHPVAPAAEAFVVFGVVLVAVGPFAWRERVRASRPLGAWLAVAYIGVADALNALLFFWSMQTTTLAIAVLSHYLAPVLVAAAAPFVLRERLRRPTIIALACALGGLTLLLEPWRALGPSALAGAALGAASAVFYASNLLVFKRIQAYFSPLEVLAWHMVVALLVLFPFVPPASWAMPNEVLLRLVAAGALPGAIAGVLFVRGLARVHASRASVLTLLEPVVAVLVGALFWGEVPSVIGFGGAVLVLLGAWIVLRTDSVEGDAKRGDSAASGFERVRLDAMAAPPTVRGDGA